MNMSTAALEKQKSHLSRIERRVAYLKLRIAEGSCKRIEFEIVELEALEWACVELRKVIASNELIMRHFAAKFAERVD